MATVRLYGDLAGFGDKFRVEVRDAKEALRLLFSQVKGLKQKIEKGFYRVRVKGEDLSERTLESGFSAVLRDKDVIHIIPVVAGAKSGGLSSFINIIAGAAMIGVAIFTGNVALGVAGVGMLIGGVATLLTPTPEISTDSASKESTSFSTLENLAPQGRVVPLVYGKMMVGSLVIGQGLRTRDVAI